MIKHTKNKLEIKAITIKLSGDSGDGMQLIGQEITQTSILFGNDVETLPDFPAEIRAPMGTIAGVSGFQIKIGSYKVLTPGDEVDALVVMNPAALKADLNLLKLNGTLIINTDTFSQRGLKLANYLENPLENQSLTSYQTFKIPLSSLNQKALENIPQLSFKNKERCKNFFALGMLLWLYNRGIDQNISSIKKKFKHNNDLILANITALKAGYSYCLATESFISQYHIPATKTSNETYRNISGNEALVSGIITAAFKASLKVVYCSYPITPASDILHLMAKMKSFNAITFQAEDEISAVCSALGASYSGALGITGSSGPGISLKMEAINLAVMTELPLVVLNIQRAGPSTGLPTKTEQADLLQALFGRNGESPIPVLAPNSVTNCFDIAIKACKIAIKYMTPVIVLSDGYLGNGTSPWKVPNISTIPTIKSIDFSTNKETFSPYKRNQDTLARSWVIPGMKDLEHRIGGLEKEHITGNVSYDPNNHHFMCQMRKEKINKIALSLPKININGKEKGKLLVIGWGSTYGAITIAVNELLTSTSLAVSSIHLQYLNPFPNDLKDILSNFEQVLVPEINLGQLSLLLKATYQVKLISFNLIKGLPLKSIDIKNKILEIFKSTI